MNIFKDEVYSEDEEEEKQEVVDIEIEKPEKFEKSRLDKKAFIDRKEKEFIEILQWLNKTELKFSKERLSGLVEEYQKSIIEEIGNKIAKRFGYNLIPKDVLTEYQKKKKYKNNLIWLLGWSYYLLPDKELKNIKKS